MVEARAAEAAVAVWEIRGSLSRVMDPAGCTEGFAPRKPQAKVLGLKVVETDGDSKVTSCYSSEGLLNTQASIHDGGNETEYELDVNMQGGMSGLNCIMERV